MKHRVDAVRRRIEHHRLDAILVSSLKNIRYLFGFTGSNALALISASRCIFVTDRRYTAQSAEQVQNAEIVISEKDLLSALKNEDFLPDKARLGFEAVHLNTRDFLQLKNKFSRVQLVATERLVEKIASIKEAEEVEHIRAAGSICANVFADVVPLIRRGVSELDISAEITYRAMKSGSERNPFEPIVASGKRAALPHGISSGKKIKAGDLVIIDFGAVVNGYAADCTRTVVVGKIKRRQKQLIGAVQGALDLAEVSAKPGMTGRQLDAVARDHLRSHQLADFFQHSLGHGLGLDVHELPRIGETSNDPIEAGNVITLEPGVYLPDFGGIRIENDYLITGNGVENLTPFPREVVCVE